MKHLTKTLRLIALMLAPLSADPGFSYSPPAETDLKVLQSSCDRIREAFAESLLAYNTPGGMVIFHDSNCEGVRYIGSSIKQTDSLSERLDSLVQAVPSYKWAMRDGVVNLQPRDSKARLLDIQIAHFSYNTNSNLDSILNSLKNTPEFLREIDRLNLNDGPYFGGLQSPPLKKAATEIVFQNKSVRQILNDIVGRRGRGLWVYSERVIDHHHRFTLQFVIK